MKRIPLAWLQLTREKRRFFAAISGIAFAVALMLIQLGFEDALLSSVALVQSHLSGDLVLINPQYQFILAPKTFTERRLYQTLGVDGVESVEPVYVGQASFKNLANRTERQIFMMGFNPRSAVLNAPGVAGNLEKLRDPETVLIDSIRRPEFGSMAETVSDEQPAITEANGHRVEIIGSFQLGTGFGIDGTLVMSDETFLRVLPFRKRGIIDVGLITVKPGADPERVRTEIMRILPSDVQVLTHDEFVQKETTYWTTNTPTGFIFKLGVLMGIFVGSIIVYQILYSDVTDHLPEYATLKAMGYPDRFLFKIVIQESLILSVFGYLPGVLVSQLAYTASQKATLLPLKLTVARVVVVYFLTVLMCAISAALAMRRLKAADPAEIF